jgi:hypothetical protein
MNQIALKIQRRRSPRSAINEISIVKAVQRQGACDAIVQLHEPFFFDGHFCLAYGIHGRSLEDEIQDRPLTVRQCLAVTRQVLGALQHLHAAGFTHTDLKPDNILYHRRSGKAKLADLGSAVKDLETGDSLCTREYCPPEVLLGAPLTPAIDYWSLGCTVYEMLTGEPLFDPRGQAALKYKEFYFIEEEVEDETQHESVAADLAEEEAEQYSTGTLIAGKYRLAEKLGQGRFGTVWAAELAFPDVALDGSYDTLWQHCCDLLSQRPDRSEAEAMARSWQKEKGADDLRDLALNHEQLLQMDRLFGPLPPELLLSGTFRTSFFTLEGRFRHPGPRVVESCAARLRAGAPQLPAAEIRRFTQLISTLCDPDPARRTNVDPRLLLDPRPRATRGRKAALAR